MKFTDRFDVGLDLKEARSRFVNRTHNAIMGFLEQTTLEVHNRIHEFIANALGKRFHSHESLPGMIGNDFYTNLQALEAFYQAARRYGRRDVTESVQWILDASEIDLGIEWRNDEFQRKGARLLDDALVNDQLHWLRLKNYESVLKPYEKGLRDLLEAHTRPEKLSDVITEMYEAVEALAKIITGKPNKDLSANRESFLSAVKASDAYKTILREYIVFANKFRHAETEGKPKPIITERETESFLYLTGIFLRLAMPEK